MHPATEEIDHSHGQMAESITWRILSSDSNSPRYAKLGFQSSFAEVRTSTSASKSTSFSQ